MPLILVVSYTYKLSFYYLSLVGTDWGPAIFEYPAEMDYVLNNALISNTPIFIGGSTNATGNSTFNHTPYLHDNTGSMYGVGMRESSLMNAHFTNRSTPEVFLNNQPYKNDISDYFFYHKSQSSKHLMKDSAQ